MKEAPVEKVVEEKKAVDESLSSISSEFRNSPTKSAKPVEVRKESSVSLTSSLESIKKTNTPIKPNITQPKVKASVKNTPVKEVKETP